MVLSAVLPVVLALAVPMFAGLAHSTSAKAQSVGGAIEIVKEIRATPGTEAPMLIQVRPWSGMPRQMIMLVRGLPADVQLSEGRAFGPGVWAVPPANAGDLRLTPGRNASGSAEITVALVTLDGATLAEAKSVLRIGMPEQGSRQENTAALTALPMRGAPAATRGIEPVRLSPADEERLGKLVEKGDESMKTGKVSAARLFYQHAADGGSSSGALALGATYDTNELKRLNIAGGVHADGKLARQWYGKARELGSAEATARLQRLGDR